VESGIGMRRAPASINVYQTAARAYQAARAQTGGRKRESQHGVVAALLSAIWRERFGAKAKKRRCGISVALSMANISKRQRRSS
jgi:CRISPR/Cas system-associated endonuclease Cas3-HD